LSITAILSALAEEQSGLIACLQKPERVKHAGRDFWLGELHGHRVVLALSRIGKVAAATTATALIEAFGASRIVFTGVAGGLSAGICVGDLVVADAFVQHDMDASPLFPRYEMPLYQRAVFECDSILTAALLQACHASGLGDVHLGLIASGDRFVSSANEAQALMQSLRAAGLNPMAVEMEGAAVAQVCHDYAVPFAAVRTVSDRADEHAHVDFSVFVTDVAGRYACAIVNALLKQWPLSPSII
jgi:adenosylhomocysteine nucleosidase